MFLFFNDTATTEIYTLSLHDALPIFGVIEFFSREVRPPDEALLQVLATLGNQLGQFMERERAEEALRESEARKRSEEHTSELQSRQYLVCRLLLEKKKKHIYLYLHRS